MPAPKAMPAAKRPKTKGKPFTKTKGGYGKWSSKPSRTQSAPPYRKFPKLPKPLTAIMAARKHDPLGKSWMLAVPGALGSAVAVPSIARATLDTSTTNTTYLVVQWNQSATRAVTIAADRTVSSAMVCGQLKQWRPDFHKAFKR